MDWDLTLQHLGRHTSERWLLRMSLAVSTPGTLTPRAEGRREIQKKAREAEAPGRHFPEADLCIWRLTKQSNTAFACSITADRGWGHTKPQSLSRVYLSGAKQISPDNR